MSKVKSETEKRKKDHIQICLTNKPKFRQKSAGFDKYEFEHFAATELRIDEIDISAEFFGKKISAPFFISCMTGGTVEAESINAQLAEAAAVLNIPVGVGSQRQALESGSQIKSYKLLREKASGVPVLANIGAAQFARFKDISFPRKLVEMIQADALVVHINPLQELIQKKGEPEFKGLLKNLEKFCAKLDVPVIAKEVGSGLGKNAAKLLLNAGVRGIDVAGAGGTSWAGVEYLRNNSKDGFTEFWDWGLPTTYCLRKVNKLKKTYYFTLIASGGISNGLDIAKSIALGADLAASARPVLQAVVKSGADGVVDLLKSWFNQLVSAMYLTATPKLENLTKAKLIKTKEMY